MALENSVTPPALAALEVQLEPKSLAEDDDRYHRLQPHGASVSTSGSFLGELDQT